MSEASRFTITLGRTGQVVKRDGTGLEGFSSARHPIVGNKRSVKDRLGVNGVSTQFKNKRLRGDGRMDYSLNDMHLSRDDLRHRIKRKNVVDLRSTMSRQAQSSSSTSSLAEGDQSPHQKDNRIPFSESIDSRQQRSTILHGTQNPHHRSQEYVRQQRPVYKEQLMHGKMETQRRLPQLDDRRSHMETMDDRRLIPVTRSSTQSIQEYRRQQIPDSTKELMHDTKESGRRISQLDDHMSHLPNANSVRKISQIPAPRTTNTLTKLESQFDPYSPWTVGRLRHHSPDEALPSSVVTRDAEVQRRYAGRTYEVANPSTHTSKDALELSRPATSAYLSKRAPPVGPTRTLASVNAAPPMPTSFAQKSPYLVDNNSVQSLLSSLSLQKYSALFKVEEVDMCTLKQMTEIDLKTLGLPMGPRKKILLALQPRPRMQV